MWCGRGWDIVTIEIYGLYSIAVAFLDWVGNIRAGFVLCRLYVFDVF